MLLSPASTFECNTSTMRHYNLQARQNICHAGSHIRWAVQQYITLHLYSFLNVSIIENINTKYSILFCTIYETITKICWLWVAYVHVNYCIHPERVNVKHFPLHALFIWTKTQVPPFSTSQLASEICTAPCKIHINTHNSMQGTYVSTLPVAASWAHCMFFILKRYSNYKKAPPCQKVVWKCISHTET